MLVAIGAILHLDVAVHRCGTPADEPADPRPVALWLTGPTVLAAVVPLVRAAVPARTPSWRDA